MDAILKVLDGLGLAFNGLLHLVLDLLYDLGVEGRVLNELVQLGLLLLELLNLCLQLTCQHQIVHLRVLFNLACELIELVL